MSLEPWSGFVSGARASGRLGRHLPDVADTERFPVPCGTPSFVTCSVKALRNLADYQDYLCGKTFDKTISFSRANGSCHSVLKYNFCDDFKDMIILHD